MFSSSCTAWLVDIQGHPLKRKQRQFESKLPRGHLHEPNPRQTYAMVGRPVRPYAPAILRFHVSFPLGYPDLPPLITFNTDIFHPLVTPVTTYTGASTPDSGTQGAPDEQRLPPGGFGLTDAFPHWFGGSERRSASTAISATTPVAQAQPSEHEQMPCTTAELLSPAEQMSTRISIAHVLGYIKRSFDDNGVLNRLPATAAVNSGAWKAWQAYRSSMEEPSNGQPNVVEDRRKPHSSNDRAIHPDDWSWEGVWERRVRKAIDASISDQVLFGAGGGVDETVSPHVHLIAVGAKRVTADPIRANTKHTGRDNLKSDLSFWEINCSGITKTCGLLASVLNVGQATEQSLLCKLSFPFSNF
ncbi:MAG: hypothetical protein Q9215_001559 [Flavoplaca cf. flavocitrina]